MIGKSLRASISHSSASVWAQTGTPTKVHRGPRLSCFERGTADSDAFNSSLMKSFIVLSGSPLAAPAIVHMPMLQIVGRREAEKSDHRHCRLLRPRGARSRHRAPNHFDEIASAHAQPRGRPYLAFSSSHQSSCG